MKTDMAGGPAADGNLEERLSRRFATELEQAERDYPTLGRRRAVAPGRRRAGLTWPRLAVPVVAIFMLAAVGLVGFGLIAAPGHAVTGPGGPAAALGSDGIPNQIDGEHVYRVGEKVESQKQGWYLLGGYVFQEIANCPSSAGPPMPCFGLGPIAGSDATTGGIDVSVAVDASDPNPPAFGDWLGAPVVARMKGCSWDNGTPCPPVVMAVVWPEVPTQLNGERVYRATDQASFPTSGSFLLGGRFAKPSVMPPCPMRIDTTAAEQQLIPYCYVLSIDGLDVAPMSNLDEPNNEIVVARVHIDDPLAAQCPASTRPGCEASIVVESVAWRSDALLSASPSDGAPANIIPTANPASSGAAGASAVVPPAGPSFAVSSVSVSQAPPPPPASVGPIESGGAPAPSPILPSPWSSAGPVAPATAPAAGG